MNKQIVKQISSLLKITEADLTSKLEADGEQQLDIQGTFYTDSDLEKRITNDPNYKSEEEITTLVESVREATLEKWTKEKKRELGIDFTGKDPNELIKKIQESKISDTGEETQRLLAKIQGLETERQQILESKTSLETELTGKINGLSSEKDDLLLNFRLKTMTPKDLLIADDKIIKLFKSDYKIEKDDKGKQFLRDGNGEILKDSSTFEYKNVEDVYKEYTTQFVSAPKGRGGRTDYGQNGKPDSLDSFNENWEKSGKSMKGLEYQNALAEFSAEQAN